MELSITSATKDGICLVSVSGEVDVSNAPTLREALDGALSNEVSQVEVDLADVSYIDSTGIGVLVGSAHRAADQGSELVVTHPQRNVERVLTMLGVDSELNVRS